MKTTKDRRLAAFLISMLAFAATATATATATAAEADRGQGNQQQGGKHQSERPTFADVDLNADGAIDESEFYQVRGERIAKRAAEGRELKHLADAPDFSDLDTDGDGRVSEGEFAAHQTARHQQRSASQAHGNSQGQAETQGEG